MTPQTTEAEEFGARLRAKRDARGFTQQELGERAGQATQAISGFENGHRGIPQAKTLKALARALRCSTDYLLGFKQP